MRGNELPAELRNKIVSRHKSEEGWWMSLKEPELVTWLNQAINGQGF